MNWIQVYRYAQMREEERLHLAEQQDRTLDVRRLRAWLVAVGEQLVAWGQALLKAAGAAHPPIDVPSR
jgi:hypothetical protein